MYKQTKRSNLCYYDLKVWNKYIGGELKMKRFNCLLLVLFFGLILVGCHKHDFKAEVTAPTCTEKGYTTYTCKCGEDSYIADYVDALGHSYGDWKVVTEATETARGLKERECSRCANKQTEEIPMKEHEHKYEDKVVAPTCIDDGYTEHICKCGYVYRDNETKALGHTEEVIPAVAPTCAEKGKTEGKKCSTCGIILEEQSDVAALGHTYGEWTITKEATETEKGLRERTCSVCNEKQEQEIPVIGHNHSYTTVTVAPTCTEQGYTTFTCECGDTYVSSYVEALGHTEQVIPAVAATCTEKGKTEGKICTVCETITVAQEEVAALGHTEVELPAVAATCTATGLTAGKKCSVCEAITVAQTTVAALGHTEETIPAVAATCSSKGLTEGKVCSVCDTILVAQQEVKELPHTEVEIPAVAATCTEGGRTAGKKCSVCDKVLQFQLDTRPLGHTEKVIAGKAATCTEDGLTDGKVCTVCEEVLVAQTVIKTEGHKEIVVDGYKETCTKDGLTDGVKCEACGETLLEQEVIKAHHTEEVIPAVAATCTKDGLTEGKKCSVCDEILVKQTKVPAGHVKLNYVAPVDPTCTTKGNTLGITCEVCKAVLIESKEIAALGHDWSAWNIVLEPTETTDGSRQRTCNRCDLEEKEVYNGEYIKIKNIDDLFAFAKDVNENGNIYLGKTVHLLANIDLKGKTWLPIGQTTYGTGSNVFAGTFDGHGYTISNMTVDSSKEYDPDYTSGFFGFIDAAGATIKNLNIENANVTGHHYVSALVGYMSNGKIENCVVVNSKISNTHYDDNACGDKAGLILGYADSLNAVKIENCIAKNSTVETGRDGGQLVGAGFITSLTDCSAINVTVKANGTCNDTNVYEKLVGRNLEGYYYILSVEDLILFANEVKANKSFAGETVKLLADLDLEGTDFNGVGVGSISSYPGYAFDGTFDGQDHTISNMTISSLTGECSSVGFFSALTGNAIVKNVNFDNAEVMGNHYAGIIAGYASTEDNIQIINCNVTNSRVSSLAHEIESEDFDNGDGDKAAAIIGYITKGLVENCTVENTIVQAVRDLGAIVGCADEVKVKDCTIDEVQLYIVGALEGTTERLGENVNDFVGRKTTNTTETNCTGTATVDTFH